jgi:hypothetical protein
VTGVFSTLLAIEALVGNNLSLVIETTDDPSCIVPFVRELKLLHPTSVASSDIPAAHKQ